MKSLITTRLALTLTVVSTSNIIATGKDYTYTIKNETDNAVEIVYYNTQAKKLKGNRVTLYGRHAV